MSHQMDMTIFTLSCHTVVFTKFTTFIVPTQNAYVHIPTFHDRRPTCEARGRTERMIPKKLPIGVKG